MSFREVSDQFMSEHAEIHLRQSTINEYRRMLRSDLLPRFGKRPMQSIARADVEAMKREKVSTKYQANRLIALVRGIFNYAIKQSLVDAGTNPTADVLLFKEEGREKLTSSDEQARIANALQQLRLEHPENSSSYDVVVFLFFTGCRTGDAFNLKWTDIDFERRVLKFTRPKTVSRPQPMSDELVEFLQALKSEEVSGYVFPGRNPDRPLTTIKKSWARIRRIAGVEDVRLHDIRHTVLSDIEDEYSADGPYNHRHSPSRPRELNESPLQHSPYFDFCLIWTSRMHR